MPKEIEPEQIDGNEYEEDDDLTGPYSEIWSVDPDEVPFLLAVAAQVVEEQRLAGKDKDIAITFTHLPESVAPSLGNEIYELEVSSIELMTLFHNAVKLAREAAEIQALEEFEGPFDEPWIIPNDRVEAIKQIAENLEIEMKWEADLPEKDSKSYFISAQTAQALSDFHDHCDELF